MTPAVLVFSHLRWDFVYQRPQHLLSRLARRHRVLFLEEPVHEPLAAPRLEVREAAPGVTVARPVTPSEAAGYHAQQLALIEPLLAQWLADENAHDHLAWFYTPMALPLMDALSPRAVVYDCMDELSAFRGAPPQLRQREAALLQRADLVLTGGPSLYEAKRHLHPNAHCVPSSVDAAHYAPDGAAANGPEAAEAQRLQGSIAAPRLGYFGVIDERLDLDLVAALAAARPDWQIVMAGPVAKLDPASLPRSPNLHWLGQQPYERLPALAAGWDVCLLPFALNEHTRFISPTKTLEYLAAHKPVVGTPIKDMVDLYGAAVEVADAGPAFIDACARLLAEDAGERAERRARSARMVARHSWDATADRVSQLVAQALQQAPDRSVASA